MKELTTKTLLIAWIIAVLFALTFMLVFLVSYWFIIAALFLFVCYVIMAVKVLRCPCCGRIENLWDLSYAFNHTYYCQFCGCQIIIKKRTDSEEV